MKLATDLKMENCQPDCSTIIQFPWHFKMLFLQFMMTFVVKNTRFQGLYVLRMVQKRYLFLDDMMDYGCLCSTDDYDPKANFFENSKNVLSSSLLINY